MMQGKDGAKKFDSNGRVFVRIKDVAKMAGVSPTTVSNVIHGNTKKVSANTRNKIRKILDVSGYVPNMSASILAGSNSRIVAVFLSSKQRNIEQNASISRIVQSLEREIYQRNYYMIIHYLDLLEEGIQLATAWNVVGVIGIGLDDRDSQKLQAHCSVPVVSIDVYYEDGRAVANVGFDDYGGGYLMGEYLLARGLQNICFFADSDRGVNYMRWKGLEEACRSRGQELLKEAYVIIPTDFKSRKNFYKRQLANFAFTRDVLFFSSDYYAMEAEGYLSDMEINVPEEISICGWGDDECALLARPQLTTIRQDIQENAIAAVRKLFGFINGERIEEFEEKLPVKIVIRDSIVKK